MSSNLERLVTMELLLAGFKAPEKEYAFHPTRKWRFDFAYPKSKVAIEAEGGVWTEGRHTRGAGYSKDCEKYNEATAMGWRIFRVTSKRAIKTLPRLILALLEEDKKDEAVQAADSGSSAKKADS